MADMGHAPNEPARVLVLNDRSAALNAASKPNAGGERDGRLRSHPQEAGRTDAWLPATSVQCHAANLMPLANGDLGCVWFGGTQEGMADISIHFARLAKGSSQWSPAEKLVDDPSRSEQNPILYPRADGTLWLLYTSQDGGRQETAVVRARTSPDHGRTWSRPWTLVGEPGTFVRQPVVTLTDGALLLPAFHCRTIAGEPWTGEHDTSSVLTSIDDGKSWVTQPVPDSRGMVHMSIVERGPGQFAAFYHSRWADNIYRSQSLDDGRDLVTRRDRRRCRTTTPRSRRRRFAMAASRWSTTHRAGPTPPSGAPRSTTISRTPARSRSTAAEVRTGRAPRRSGVRHGRRSL